MQISVPQSGTLDPNSPKLLWSTDGAANESPLVYQPASDRWVASTGPLPCNANVVWSVEVANDEGLSFALVLSAAPSRTALMWRSKTILRPTKVGPSARCHRRRLDLWCPDHRL